MNNNIYNPYVYKVMCHYFNDKIIFTYPSLDEYFVLGLNRVLSQIHPLGHHTGMLKVCEPCLS